MTYCAGHFYRCYDGVTGASSYPTILLHGLGGTHLSWPATLRRLPGQRVFALDLPGHGGTALAPCVRVDCHAASLNQFIVKMGFQRVNLVGYSMGAMIALAYATQFPERIHKLSLLSIGLQYRYADLLEQYFSLPKTKQQGIDILLEHSFHADFPRRERKVLLKPLTSMRSSLLHADAQVCANFSADRDLRGAAFPIQLIGGEDDALVPLKGMRELAACLPGAKLQVIKQCGHSIVFEKTEETRNYLAAFLKDSVTENSLN